MRTGHICPDFLIKASLLPDLVHSGNDRRSPSQRPDEREENSAEDYCLCDADYESDHKRSGDQSGIIPAVYIAVDVDNQRVKKRNGQFCKDYKYGKFFCGDLEFLLLGIEAYDEAAYDVRKHPQEGRSGESIAEQLVDKCSDSTDGYSVDRTKQEGCDEDRKRLEGDLDAGEVDSKIAEDRAYSAKHSIDHELKNGKSVFLVHKKAPFGEDCRGAVTYRSCNTLFGDSGCEATPRQKPSSTGDFPSGGT